MLIDYRLPPRNDNRTTTKGPAATTRNKDASWKTTSKFIINWYDWLKKIIEKWKSY